jgi:sugar O-acyltransferase (sialic acid O-acetyltransferase NeuD family)
VTHLLILGTREFASEIADVAAAAGHDVVGFVENLDRDRCREGKDGLPVHWIEDVDELARDHRAVCGLGTTLRSRFVADAEAHGIGFVTVVHPTAVMSARARAEEGTIVGATAVVGAGAALGRHVLVNRAALVGHHTRIGDFTTVGPGANIAGSCTIGPRVYLGMSSVVIDHVTVGEGAVIAAGAVVTGDVERRTMVAGTPAKVMKRDVEPK